MDNNWKFVIKILAALLSLVIVCVTINVSVGKLTAAVTNSNSQPEYNQQPNGGYNQGVIDNSQGGSAPVVSDPTGGTVPNAGSVPETPVTTPNGNGGTQQPNSNPAASSNDPTSFSKDQLISYYNGCLRKAYSQPKFTVKKTEVVDVTLGKMLLNGKPATNIQSIANKIVAKNKEKGGTDTKSFTSANARVDAQKRFILPANLYPAAVKTATISKSGQGYVIKFVLNSESCDFKTKPPYNSSCTFPLDFNEIDLGGIGTITSANFYYSGTSLTATIDGQGRVSRTDVVMPLSVKNATGEGMGQKLTVDISGRWLCTNLNMF